MTTLRVLTASLRLLTLTTALLAAAGSCGGKGSKAVAPVSDPLPADRGLRSVADFDATPTGKPRALALFQEVGKVLLHPRCVNCHPADDRPLQRDGLPHQPHVLRGPEGRGVAGLPCKSCHGEQNYLVVPGDPDWHLAPLEMGWAGRTLGQICRQIKDPERNGGKTMEQIAVHVAEDHLVAYGWKPPAHLEPVPGNQALFGQLFQAWMANGAHCPE